MKSLQGKKTYISLLIVVLGMVGFGDLISEGELAGILNSILEIIGTIGVIYGRYKAKV